MYGWGYRYLRFNLTAIPADAVTDAQLEMHMLESTHVKAAKDAELLQNFVWEAEDMGWTLNTLRKAQPTRLRSANFSAAQRRLAFGAKPEVLLRVRVCACATVLQHGLICCGISLGPGLGIEVTKFSVESKRSLYSDLTELVRKHAGKTMTVAVLGGKAVATFCSARFEDKAMRPKLQIGVLKKKGREARRVTTGG